MQPGLLFRRLRLVLDCNTHCGNSSCGCNGTVACRDGICQSAAIGGTLCLKPSQQHVQLDGGLELHLNIETGVAGLVYVELLGATGAQPLPGRAFADVSPVRGNFMRKAVRWSSGTSLNDVTGTQLRLRVAMTDAKLYSATFRCRAPKQHTTSQMAMH